MPDGMKIINRVKIIEDQSASLCGSYGVIHGYYFLLSSGCFLATSFLQSPRMVWICGKQG